MRPVSTRNSLPSLSLRKGLQHWELAHRLSIFLLLPARPRTLSASHWILNHKHFTCHRGFSDALWGLCISETSPEVIFLLLCRLIGNIADTPSAIPCLCSFWPATISRMPKVLLCPPNYFDVVDQKNPYMSRESAVDRVKARTQWENLCSVLQQSGCEVETIDPVEDLEDMVFAANRARESAVDEVKARTKWENLCSVLQQSGCEVETIDPVEALEDMVFAANQVFVGEKIGYGRFVVPSR